MTLLLGVDGGGSHTRVGLFEADAADGPLRPVGSANGEGCNPLSVGWETAQSRLGSTIAQALDGTTGKPTAGVLAVAGCGSDEAHQRLEAWAVAQDFADRISVAPDTAPVLAAVPVGKVAIGLIAGTGSAAFARHTTGETETVGGWGYLIGDAGSGYALGRDALARLAQVADAGAPIDALGAALLDRAGVDRPSRVKAILYGAERVRAWVADLAPTVLALSAAGDPIARRIADENAAALVQIALDAAARVAAAPHERPPIYYTGSLLTRSEHYGQLTRKALSAAGWSASDLHEAVEGSLGCALLAQRSLAQS